MRVTLFSITVAAHPQLLVFQYCCRVKAGCLVEGRLSVGSWWLQTVSRWDPGTFCVGEKEKKKIWFCHQILLQCGCGFTIKDGCQKKYQHSECESRSISFRMDSTVFLLRASQVLSSLQKRATWGVITSLKSCILLRKKWIKEIIIWQ